MDAAKIDKVASLLEDDHYRQGGVLEPDQVLQAGERHGLTPQELLAVQAELRARGILEAEGPEEPEPLPSTPEARPEPPEKESPEARDRDLLQQYLQEIGRVELLSAAEEVSLARRIEIGERAAQELLVADLRDSHGLKTLAEEGLQAKQQMAAANLRFVVMVAKRHMGRGMDLSDLIQEGTLGLLRAVERFDHKRGFRFVTYATWWIRAAITRALADKSRTIRVPVHAVDLLHLVRKTTFALTREHGGREPTIDEVAAHVRRDPTEIQFLLDIAREPLSLDSPGNDDEGTLGDVVASARATPEEELLGRETATAILQAIEALPDREREIIRLRYGLEDGTAHTLKDIGQRYGVSRERIRQIESEALETLRRPTAGNPLRELILVRRTSAQQVAAG